MNPIRPARKGGAAQRPSVTRGPNDLWLSSAVALERGACPRSGFHRREGGGR